MADEHFKAALEEIIYLLTLPYFWTPLSICLFLNKCYDLLDELQRKEKEDFLKVLNSKAESVDVFETSRNQVQEGWILPEIDRPIENRNGWANALSEEEFVGLTAFHQKGKVKKAKKLHEYNTSCIFGLLKLIRDKYQHRNDLSEGTKNVLGWSAELSKEHNLTAFWTKTFPKLLAFLYINLYEKFEKHDPNNLNAFYCDLVDFQKYPDVIDLPGLSKNLRESLFNVMAKGYLPTRFTGERANQRTKMNEKSIILEFRQMPAGLLSKLLPKESNWITIVVKKGLLQYFWMDAANKMKYSFSSAMEEEEETEEYSMIFCISGEIFNQNEKSEVYSKWQYTDKIIIFASSEESFSCIKSDMEERLGFQFSELPVTLADFREDIRQQISNCEVRLGLHEGNVRLLDLFFGDVDKLPNHIKYPVMESALRKGHVTVFENNVPPKRDHFYLERNLVEFTDHRTTFLSISADMFELLNDENAVFLLSNITEKELKTICPEIRIGKKFKDVSNITKETLRTICPEIKMENLYCYYDRHYTNISNKLEVCLLPDNYQSAFPYTSNCKTYGILSYIGNATFKWLYGVYEFFQTKLLERIDTTHNTERLIFLFGKSGIGKSQLLKEMASQQSNLGDRCVLFVDMNKFLESVKANLAKANNDIYVSVVMTINELVSSIELDKRLIEFWFSENLGNRIMFELFFDGLDEVQAELVDWALTILKILRKRCPSVRVWVACKDHMVNRVYEKLSRHSILCYQIAEFSHSEALDFIKVHCKNTQNIEETQETKIRIVSNYATQCCSILTREQLPRTPMYCTSVAQYFMHYLKSALNEEGGDAYNKIMSGCLWA